MLRETDKRNCDRSSDRCTPTLPGRQAKKNVRQVWTDDVSPESRMGSQCDNGSQECSPAGDQRCPAPDKERKGGASYTEGRQQRHALQRRCERNEQRRVGDIPNEDS